VEREACEIRIGNTLMVGCYPRLPVRFLLHGAMKEALGYTPADQRAIAEREPGEPIPEPSLAGDGYAISCVYYAAIGLCWPDDLPVDSLRKLRHDVVAYGEGVFEHFVVEQAADAQALAAEGKRLLYAMIREGAGTLKEEIKLERDFTEGRGDPSIAG
jgi:hypothetical protein